MNDLDINTPEGMEGAKAWLENLLSVLADQATWIVPRSGSIVTINKTSKTASILTMFPDESLGRVFEAIGYKVKML